MWVRVLGTAAGGGSPQWNCACAQCDWARAHGMARTQDSLAVSGNGSDWYLTGAPDPRWSNDQLHTLHRVPGSAFEVVQTRR